MKIRSNAHMGTIRPGDVVDAAVSPDRQKATAFDNHNMSWFFGSGQFEIIEPSTLETEKPSTQDSLRNLIGQDLQEVTLRFK